MLQKDISRGATSTRSARSQTALQRHPQHGSTGVAVEHLGGHPIGNLGHLGGRMSPKNFYRITWTHFGLTSENKLIACWGKYVSKSLNFPSDVLEPRCSSIFAKWYYHQERINFTKSRKGSFTYFTKNAKTQLLERVLEREFRH